MAKSKHRKNHKQKVQQRKVRIEGERKKTMKFQQRMFEQFQLQQEIAKREKIVETIYRNRPEIAKENDEGLLVYNDEILEYKEDGVLYWKENNNPLLAGLEALENYTMYTEELVNQFLQNVQHRDKLKQQEIDDSGMSTEMVEDLEAELGGNSDFELELDDNFIQDAVVVVEEVTSIDSDQDNKDE